jgi:hypothetical protein
MYQELVQFFPKRGTLDIARGKFVLALGSDMDWSIYKIMRLEKYGDRVFIDTDFIDDPFPFDTASYSFHSQEQFEFHDGDSFIMKKDIVGVFDTKEQVKAVGDMMDELTHQFRRRTAEMRLEFWMGTQGVINTGTRY